MSRRALSPLIQQINKRREALGWTEAELARRSNFRAISIYTITRGTRGGSLETIDKLIVALGGQPVHPQIVRTFNLSRYSYADIGRLAKTNPSLFARMIAGRHCPNLALVERLIKILKIPPIEWDERARVR